MDLPNRRDEPRICAHCGNDEPPVKKYRDELWLLRKYRDDAQAAASAKHYKMIETKRYAAFAVDTAERIQRLLETTLDAVNGRRRNGR